MNIQRYLHPVSFGLNALRIASILFLLFSAFGPAFVVPVLADRVDSNNDLVCGIPGRDGPATLSGIINTYYPGTADVGAGAASIPVGSPVGGPAIAAGDLLLVIQMQAADINSTNTDAYGDGVAGGAASGATNITAGRYEYVVATGGVSGGSVPISTGLQFSYDFEDFGTQGQRRFQVIRIPQNSSATISGTVSALAWNGSVGGVVAIDVAGTLTFSGGTINVSGQGFRGGGGVRSTGAAGLSNTDIRTLSTSAANGAKGEGIAGTPRYVYNGATVQDLTTEGYPNGTNARGAPGNAGGGATDGTPIDNAQNSGGGGGGNGGAGGLGGNTWQSNVSRGGYGGTSFGATAGSLVMGGGGGAGSNNNPSNFTEPAGNVNNPVLSSGAPGGGIVMIRAGTVAGNGTINADGADAPDQPDNESGGGGGAGGSVLVVAQTALPGGLNVTATGGDGGDAWPTRNGANWRHGPGGGGGGGVIFLSSTAGTLSVAGGVHGITTTANDIYGSANGSAGVTGTAVGPSNVPYGISGAECVPTPVVVKTTSTPQVTQTASGTSGTYTINVSIPAGQGTALELTINDDLPDNFFYNSTVGPIGLTNATRVTTANPVPGTNTPSWGTFQIAGGGSVQITFTVDIAASVPAGIYQNPANATYLDPRRTTQNGTSTTQYDVDDPGEDIEVVTAAAPDMTILKSETSTGPYAVGGTITYSIVVTNTGNTSLTGVTVSDSSASVGTCTPAQPATLAVGATMTCPASHVVTQADVDAGSYVNTATGDSNETPPVTSTVTVLFTPTPALTVDKNQTSNGPYVVGDTITYSIVVTNSGNVTLTGVTATDNSATVGVCTPAQPSTLVPGASMTCPASHVVTQADVNNGSYVNTATGDSNETPPDTSTVTVLFTPSPALSVVKSQTSNGPYAVGDTITYNIVVTNTGNITLTGVTVADNSASLGTCTPAQPASLNPGASITCAASHVVTQADVNNGSYVNTATGDSDQTPPDTSTVTVPFTPDPTLNVVKSQTSSGPYVVGNTITYSIVVTNTGNVTLTGVTASDNSASLGTCTPAQPATLAPGDSMSCSASHVVTQSDINNGSYVNTATGDSNETPPDTSTVTVPFTPTPELTTVKSETSNGPYVVGDTITYSIVVTNSGNVTLTGVTVADNTATLGACAPAQPTSLVPGADITCPASHVVTQADIDNGSYVNTATGDSNETPPDTSTVTVPFAPSPSLNVVKSQTSNGPYVIGDTITYSIVVTNTGNTTLSGVTITDNSATVGACSPAQPSTLVPGATMTCPASHVVTQSDISAGNYVNTATADSNETPPDTSTVTVDFSVADLSLSKTVNNSTPAVGATITFTLTVSNIGPDPATGVQVTDQLPAGYTFVSAAPSQGTYSNATGIWTIGDMAVNAAATLTMTVTVNATGPYRNTAQVSAVLEIDPDSRPNNNVASEDDQDSVTIGSNPDPDPDPDPDPSPSGNSAFLIPVTGFKPNVVTDLSRMQPETYLSTGDVTLEIPSLGVKIAIVGVPKKDGKWNVAWLSNEAGWLEGSAFPSWNGNSVLTGHAYLASGKPGPFVDLGKLKYGDRIIVHAYGQKYTFAVQTNTVVEPNDASVMKHEEKPWLTLVTCKDYSEQAKTYLSRVIVRAALVQVEFEK